MHKPDFTKSYPGLWLLKSNKKAFTCQSAAVSLGG